MRLNVIRAFQRFDLDGNGRITLSELRRVMRHLDENSWADDKITQLFTAMNGDTNDWISYKEFVDWSWRCTDALTIIRQLQGCSWPPPPPQMLPRPRPCALNLAAVFRRHSIVQRGTDIGIATHLGIPGKELAWELRRVSLPTSYDKFPGDPLHGIPKGSVAFEYFHIIYSLGEIPQYLTRSPQLALQPALPSTEAHLQWWALIPATGSGYRLKSMSQDDLESILNSEGFFAVSADTVWTIADHEGEPFDYKMGKGMKRLLRLMFQQEADEVRDRTAQAGG